MKRITIITGHYGSGKTTVAVNMAVNLARENKKVTIVDLDTVNPYFRTSDFHELFKKYKIELVAPTYAGSNLDIPAVAFDLERIISDDGYVIIDVGGDDAGAYALGRYAPMINAIKSQTDMLYVINYYRYLTHTPTEATELMFDIEHASRITHTGIVNNSSLGYETTGEEIEKSNEFAEQTAQEAKLPLVFTTYRKGTDINISPKTQLELFVRPIWEK